MVPDNSCYFHHFLLRVDNEWMGNVLRLFTEDQDIVKTPLSQKFVEAAQYGKIKKDVAKCEQRYRCSLSMQIIQHLF